MSSTTNGCAQFSKQLAQLQNCVFTVFHILQLCTYSPDTCICIYRVSKKRKTKSFTVQYVELFLELFPFKLTLLLESKATKEDISASIISKNACKHHSDVFRQPVITEVTDDLPPYGRARFPYCLRASPGVHRDSQLYTFNPCRSAH